MVPLGTLTIIVVCVTVGFVENVHQLEEAVSITEPVYPLSGFTVIFDVPDFPCAMVRVVGLADKEKSGDGGGAVGKVYLSGLPTPVTRS